MEQMTSQRVKEDHPSAEHKTREGARIESKCQQGGDHQDKNETTIWKIKAKSNSNGTTNQQSKHVTEDHTNINNKNRIGKLLHNLQAPHDHSTAPCNNAKSVSQNEHEKGKHVMQEDGKG
ncbi:hypothetical protein H5410_047035 [Solanum commersonii]|uniref:Uncharacterized protein n=1 Tax=Solanum commersonii TaxID=4109 RepID=A0A9J5XDX0_SOLCO|nr:hypothetical protein H5410_047035 [Solanum commersonii]